MERGEIISHLADCEIVFAFRLRQTLAEDNPTIQPFDQDKWAVLLSPAFRLPRRLTPSAPCAIGICG